MTTSENAVSGLAPVGIGRRSESSLGAPDALSSASGLPEAVMNDLPGEGASPDP